MNLHLPALPARVVLQPPSRLELNFYLDAPKALLKVSEAFHECDL